MSKYIFRYKKEGIAKYISHLDFLRATQRSFRRAEIPLEHSHGFNPRPLLSFALPLALGITGECEAFEAVLKETDLSENEILSKLNIAFPEGIIITSVAKNEGNNRFSDIASAIYIVTPESMPLNEQIPEFLTKDEIMMDKKTKKGIKPTDIKQNILDISLKEYQIIMTLSAGNTQNLNPVLVIDALNKYIPAYCAGFCSYHRYKIFDNKGIAF